jgi:hypothetical protein
MYIEELARAKKTVFSVADFRILWKIDDSAYLKTVISRLFRRGSIIRLSRGIYALDDSYDRFELANKLKVPSYVSLETVLAKENIIFQRYDDVIYSMSDRATVKQVGKTEYRYRRLVKRVLLDPLGIRSGPSAIDSSSLPDITSIISGVLIRSVCDSYRKSITNGFDRRYRIW